MQFPGLLQQTERDSVPETVLTRAPMGYSRTLPADEGGIVSSPPPPRAIYLPNYWTDSRSENGTDNSGLELSEYVAKLYVTVTGNVTGRDKGHFYYLSLLASPDKSNRIKLM